jgi:hypothetical protein
MISPSLALPSRMRETNKCHREICRRLMKIIFVSESEEKREEERGGGGRGRGGGIRKNRDTTSSLPPFK